MNRLAALGLLIVAACSGPPPAPSATPIVVPSASPSASSLPVASTASISCGSPRDPIGAPMGDSIVAAIPLGCEGGAVAVSGGSVWVVPHLDRVALRIDPVANTVVGRVSLGDRGPGAEIDAAGGMLWASVSSASYDPDRLVRLDPTTESIVAWVDAAGAFPVIGAGSVWATGDGEVYRIDPLTNSLAAVIEASDCWMITLDDRAFCVGPDVAVWIDPTTDEARRIPGSETLGWPVIGVDGSIWAVDGTSLRAFDPETGQMDADIQAPDATVWSLDGVVLDGTLWATASSVNGPADQLVRIDRQRMAIDCVLPIPTSELGMAAGFGSIWLPVLRGPWLLRIEPAC
jgi:hypothetical protein